MNFYYQEALNIVLVLILVAINAFFVVSEFALVKIRKTKLEELTQKGNKRAKLALRMNNSLDSYLSAIQLGITLTSLGLGWLGEPAVSRLLERWFVNYLDPNSVLLHSLSFGIAFALITLLHVVLGELIPKSLAIQKTEYFVLFIAVPLYWFSKILYPLIFVFDRLAAKSLRLMGVEPATDKELAHSEEELKMIVSASCKGGYIDATESDIIKNAVNFSDTTALDVMRPRQKIECLFIDNSYEATIEQVKKSCYTRYPLCDKDKDNIIGVVHIRELFTNDKARQEGLKSIARDIIFVPETISISDLLHRMMLKRIHMAVVVDEYGGTSGIISMEDILEELVGEIRDEYDTGEEDGIKKLSDNIFEFDGLVSIEDAFEVMDMSFAESDYEENTIGGYVFGLLSRNPKVGDSVEYKNITFRVLKVNKLQIVKLKATIKAISEEEI